MQARQAGSSWNRKENATESSAAGNIEGVGAARPHSLDRHWYGPVSRRYTGTCSYPRTIARTRLKKTRST